MVLAGLDEPSVLLVVSILVGCNNKHLMFNYIIRARYHLWLKLTVIVNPMSCVSKNYSSAPSTASLAFIMIYTYMYLSSLSIVKYNLMKFCFQLQLNLED